MPQDTFTPLSALQLRERCLELALARRHGYGTAAELIAAAREIMAFLREDEPEAAKPLNFEMLRGLPSALSEDAAARGFLAPVNFAPSSAAPECEPYPPPAAALEQAHEHERETCSTESLRQIGSVDPRFLRNVTGPRSQAHASDPADETSPSANPPGGKV